MNVMIRDITGGGNQEELVDEIARMRKDLAFLLENLDHLNVKRLYTEYCDIRSAAGETIIDGPTLLMYDKQATPVLRLQMGYDPVTTDFVFNMYNNTGALRIGLDATTGDYIFTGGTIRTGTNLEDRIEMSGGKFRGVTAAGQITGLYFDIGTIPGTGIADITLYHNNSPLLVFYDAIDSYTIKPGSGATIMNLGVTGKTANCYGTWDFTSATIAGLSTDTAPDHTHDVTVTAVPGTFTSTASGAHSHAVS